jgi:aldehyde:ferredoxin oxidoreductase
MSIRTAGKTDIGLRPLRGLRVDVSTGQASPEELPAEVARAVLGGRGLGAYLLLRERVYELDPLAPANPLIFAPGPLTGTGAPAAGRYSVSSRSPLTGTVFDGNSGGAFGVAVRRLGLDYLVVDGACEAPSYLLIGDEGIRLLPAGELWGADVPAALARLHELHGRAEAAVIGPAGERGVLFASIVNNRGRQIGRGGLGAVMGAKRLKAIVLAVEGGSLPGPADPGRFATVIREAEDQLRGDPITSRSLPDFGTSVLLNLLDQAGALPTRNFRQSRFESAEQISGEALRAGYAAKRGACTGCFIGCAHTIHAGGESGGAPEYESLWALGADCGIGDLTAIVTATFACNRVGIDTITMGSTIACAMELAEDGLLPGGPRFGDAEALLELIGATAERRGLGDELAEGSRRFAARYGRPELAMHVKSLELPAYDPRGMTGQGLAFATSNRGACHVRANMLGPEILGMPTLIDRFATRGKAPLLIHMQDLNAVLDSLVECKFAAYVLNLKYFARLLSAVLGEDVETEELLRVGERIWTLEKLFNLRAGFARSDDSLPLRLLSEPVAEGPAKGHVVHLQPMLDEYYASRGWDELGVPSAGKLKELGLAWAAADPAAAPSSRPRPDRSPRGRSRPLVGRRPRDEQARSSTHTG